jgi:type III pantothenate kinase
MTILTIDAGNTRIKWGLFDDAGTLIEHSAFPHNDLANVRFPNAERVIISNVAGDVMAIQLAKLLEDFPLVQWLTSKHTALGVTNSYTTPGKLGSDRWAALIAAWHLEKTACLVVNAGTAVTIDALDLKGNFIGGMILPGLELMRRNLHTATAQLPFDPITATQLPAIFAIETEQAMLSGALHAVCGAINQAAIALQEASGIVPAILLSGGNAQLISQGLTTVSHVTKRVVIVDNLVLEGLFLLATN